MRLEMRSARRIKALLAADSLLGSHCNMFCCAARAALQQDSNPLPSAQKPCAIITVNLTIRISHGGRRNCCAGRRGIQHLSYIGQQFGLASRHRKRFACRAFTWRLISPSSLDSRRPSPHAAVPTSGMRCFASVPLAADQRCVSQQQTTRAAPLRIRASWSTLSGGANRSRRSMPAPPRRAAA